MEKHKDFLRHLPFVVLNSWDKVTESLAKLSVSTPDIVEHYWHWWN
jgi:hypothetical protein